LVSRGVKLVNSDKIFLAIWDLKLSGSEEMDVTQNKKLLQTNTRGFEQI